MNSLDGFLRSQLKLRQLQLLVVMDDLRNVGKVANYLHVSQPAVSKALSELENNIGLKLFNRTIHGMQPTIYGSSLVVYARRILAEAGKARDELRALMAGVQGKVSVGVLPIAAGTLLPRAIDQLKSESPFTALTITEGTMELLRPRLLAGEIELIVGILPEDTHQADTDTIFIHEEPMVLVAGTSHPLAGKKHITWSELRSTPWILPPHSSLIRQLIEDAFRRHHVALPTNYIESVATMVNIGILQQGKTVGFLPGSVARHYARLGGVTVIPVSIPTVTLPVGVLYMRNQPLSASARLLIAALKNYRDAGPRPQPGTRPPVPVPE
ncbi:LysR family transcriptional regulator [Shimwellia blattae]|uniref:Putative transcriptional regulator n=1 Tax=Shimwellia blattae (strain ATCC 29907 / DSM 4481 / JCM 1650 / NBRC 105725 / CDC 9005-74) TaxID=630626 RepID=I2BDV3_SHIBC|nr:LysR family transcriptional regulator [Shimwellia blattae]AFJ48707.1 putative transcriptional regulator [Shimwellia blattae DSM 4481 = NBRC 105725]GAB83040.1 putative LysR family transcriptional regulator [Shimwellia blattae DSM 4481 = NBRC 105725]VDY66195.1 Galactose-binding protein regulator [Shimwellia blattae]VEC27287.1 Galactose-binding protein regulator [Shimwellia blattae]